MRQWLQSEAHTFCDYNRETVNAIIGIKKLMIYKSFKKSPIHKAVIFIDANHWHQCPQNSHTVRTPRI